MNYSDIQCDNNLIKDKCCKIKYSGFLFKNNSDSVTIIYGFGDGWNNTDAQEMTKTDDGFVANIKMLDYRTFNFCFRNSNFEWDNNYGQNFSLPILEEDISEDDSSINNISIINKSTVDEILDYLYDSEVEKVTSQTEDFNIESFANNSLENKIEDFEVSVDSNLPINLEETLVSSNENIVLNEYLSSVDKTEFSMDSLINEILSPINSSNIFKDNFIVLCFNVSFSTSKYSFLNTPFSKIGSNTISSKLEIFISKTFSPFNAYSLFIDSI